MRPSRGFLVASLFAASLSAGCAARLPEHVQEVSLPSPEVLGVTAEDSAPKADLRMIPPEAYMRTYLQLFGGLAPLDAQKLARGKEGAQLFDNWDAYVSALGFADYRTDIPRLTQTNALMVATFERLGVALCDRAVEHDLRAKPPMRERAIFAFDVLPAPGVMDEGAFGARFDVLHRTFLGYPRRLAPAARTTRFFQLYRDIVGMHRTADPKSRFTPEEAGWAAVCYGLVRHPEFHLY
jgi:hypothetical protein